MTLYRNLEKDAFTESEMKKMFFNESDVIKVETGERALSLKKFVSLVTEKGLFSNKKQKEFSEKIADPEVFKF